MGELLGVAGLGGLGCEGRIRGITAGGKVVGSKKMVVDWLEVKEEEREKKEEGKEMKERSEERIAGVRTEKELEVMGTQGERTVKQDSTLSTYMLFIISRTSLAGSSIHWA